MIFGNMQNDDREFLTKVCEGLEQLRINNKRDIRESQIQAFLGTNNILSSLNKYFFTLATLLIPIIFTLASATDIKIQLTPQNSAFLINTLIFLLASILMGFLHSIEEYVYFRKWLKNTDRQLKIWSKTSFWPSAPTVEKIPIYISEYEDSKTKSAEILDEMEKQSSAIFITLQAIFLFLAVLFLAIVAFELLY